MCTGASVCIVTAARKKNRRRRRSRPARPGRWIESPRRWIDRRPPRENFRPGSLSTADVITGKSFFLPSCSFSPLFLFPLAGSCVAGGVIEMRLNHISSKTIDESYVLSLNRIKHERPKKDTEIPVKKEEGEGRGRDMAHVCHPWQNPFAKVSFLLLALLCKIDGYKLNLGSRFSWTLEFRWFRSLSLIHLKYRSKETSWIWNAELFIKW